MGILDNGWPVWRRLTDLHTFVYRATGGLIGARAAGVRMLLLDHVGARSGAVRTSPLQYIPDGDDLVLIASMGGHPRNPAWYHNLRAYPDTVVQVRDTIVPVRAEVAEGAERDRLWQRAVRTYPPYRSYQDRTDRRIPVVVLHPR